MAYSAAYARPLAPLPIPVPPPSSAGFIFSRPPAASVLRLRLGLPATTTSRGAFTCFDSKVGEYPPTIPSLVGKTPDQWTKAEFDAMMRGGDQVTSVLEDMIELLRDLEMDQSSEEVALEIVAQGVIGKRVDEMESGFMMALDFMIQLSEKDRDKQRTLLLEMIKQTVLDHLTKKCPPQVQVIGILCRTPKKDCRQELLRRVAAGGGVFEGEKGFKLHLPRANLNDIANQANDLLETMEERPKVSDRKLLTRLVLIREEARNMMGGGLLDERNAHALKSLPATEVNYLSKLVAMKPGNKLREMIKNVMLGKDEGADELYSDQEDVKSTHRFSGHTGKGTMQGRKSHPIRPGMFLDSVSKVLRGIYDANVSGITAQHLEWIHRNTLEVLQEIAF